MSTSYKTTNMLINDEECYLFGYVDYEIDKYWGADVDGNRGKCRIIINEVRDFEVLDINGEVVDLTAELIEDAQELLANKLYEDGV